MTCPSPHVRCGGEVGHGAGPGGGGVLILAEVEEGGKQYPEGPGGEACNDEGVLIGCICVLIGCI